MKSYLYKLNPLNPQPPELTTPFPWAPQPNSRKYRHAISIMQEKEKHAYIGKSVSTLL